MPSSLTMLAAAALAVASASASAASASSKKRSAVLHRDPGGPLDPWGIHIAYGQDPSTEMTVMWSTRNALPAGSSLVSLYPSSSSSSAAAAAAAAPLNVTAEDIPFSDVGNTQQIHRARVTGLLPATNYTYTVGSLQAGASFSAPYSFVTAPSRAGGADADYLPTFAIYGDMGISANADATMPLLLKDVLSGAVDIILHVGDAAYDLDSAFGLTGDAFMCQIQEIAARSVYHICPGNHEGSADFYEYRMRLGAAMPLAANAPSGGGNGTFHSSEMGPVKVILVSSEVYFSNQPHSSGLLKEQEAWLAAELAAVDRARTPFVVLGLHQPFYCSANDDQDDCHQAGSLVRAGLERIIYEGGVDLVFQAHEHSYERNYPVYNSTWDSSRTGPGAYVDYEAPIHILTGAAGCPENQDAWGKVPNPWSAVRVNDYGYSRLSVLNRTALKLEYVDNVKGAVIDTITVTKSSEGPAFPPQARDAWARRA